VNKRAGSVAQFA